jgi:hypothetical protein
VSRLIISALLFCAGCVNFFTGGAQYRAGSGLAAGAVRSFINGFGKYRPTRLNRLFTEDARIEIKGVGIVAQGRAELDDFFDFGQTVKSRLAEFELRVVNDSVFCQIEEDNDCLRLLGLEPLIYDALFIVEGKRIKTVLITPDPASRSRLMSKGIVFLGWLRRSQPAALNELMPDGKFRFTAENGRRLIELINQWQGQN